MIVLTSKGFQVYSHDGKRHLGAPYATRKEANERIRKVEAAKAAKASRKPAAVFRIDGNPETDGTLAEFKRANQDAPLSRAEYARIGRMKVGDTLQGGGGAWAPFTVKRIR